MSDMNKSVQITTREDDSKEWSYSVEEGGLNKRCTVTEAKNGYIVKVNIYGRPDSVGDNEIYAKEEASYIDETKEYISELNPLEVEDLTGVINDTEAQANIAQMKKVFDNFKY